MHKLKSNAFIHFVSADKAHTCTSLHGDQSRRRKEFPENPACFVWSIFPLQRKQILWGSSHGNKTLSEKLNQFKKVLQSAFFLMASRGRLLWFQTDVTRKWPILSLDVWCENTSLMSSWTHSTASDPGNCLISMQSLILLTIKLYATGLRFQHLWLCIRLDFFFFI